MGEVSERADQKIPYSYQISCRILGCGKFEKNRMVILSLMSVMDTQFSIGEIPEGVV